MMKKEILSLIKWYQKNQPLRLFVGSHLLLLGGDCKFIPKCSDYALQAIEKYGALKGGFLAIRRIVKCNPFSRGGIDSL